jgi:hypothetical protein
VAVFDDDRVRRLSQLSDDATSAHVKESIKCLSLFLSFSPWELPPIAALVR